MSAGITEQPRGAAAKLDQLLNDMPDRQVTLGALIDRLGPTGTGLCLVLFSLTSLVPGIAPLFGVALCAIAFGMVIGHSELLLPSRMRRWTIDRDRTEAVIRRLTPAIAWLERHLRPRGAKLLGRIGHRMIGLASLVNGVLIVLPVPFGNTAPAVALLILSLGFTTADGYAVAAGLAATVAALVIDLGLVTAGYAVAVSLFHSLF